MSTSEKDRRQFFARIVKSIQAAIGGTVGVVLGGAILSPSLSSSRDEHWLPAASLSGLPENAPTPITLRIVREDGYSQIVDHRTVFLVKTGADVIALDPTCTHLGCRVRWESEAHELRCPCHGGVYNHLGIVKSGPPPAPLPRLATKIDNDQILVQV